MPFLHPFRGRAIAYGNLLTMEISEWCPPLSSSSTSPFASLTYEVEDDDSEEYSPQVTNVPYAIALPLGRGVERSETERGRLSTKPAINPDLVRARGFASRTAMLRWKCGVECELRRPADALSYSSRRRGWSGSSGAADGRCPSWSSPRSRRRDRGKPSGCPTMR